MVSKSWKYPEHWFQTNVVAAVKLHDQLRRRDYLEESVNVTTPEVYGRADGFMQENAPSIPARRMPYRVPPPT